MTDQESFLLLVRKLRITLGKAGLFLHLAQKRGYGVNQVFASEIAD